MASLKGRLVKYLIRSRDVTIGRRTKDNDVDVDLNLEGIKKCFCNISFKFM